MQKGIRISFHCFVWHQPKATWQIKSLSDEIVVTKIRILKIFRQSRQACFQLRNEVFRDICIIFEDDMDTRLIIMNDPFSEH